MHEQLPSQGVFQWGDALISWQSNYFTKASSARFPYREEASVAFLTFPSSHSHHRKMTVRSQVLKLSSLAGTSLPESGGPDENWMKEAPERWGSATVRKSVDFIWRAVP